jgi:hypothetical protein
MSILGKVARIPQLWCAKSLAPAMVRCDFMLGSASKEIAGGRFLRQRFDSKN